MRVAVLIVTYKNATDAVRCLNALELSTYSDFEAIICENGGDVAYDELVAGLNDSALKSRTKLIKAPFNGGFAAGINLCLANAQDADLFWILNPDTEPAPGAMRALVNKLINGNYDAVGGVLRFSHGRVQSLGGVWIPWRARLESIGLGSDPKDIPEEGQIERRQNFLSGASMMIGHEFRRRAGLMREDYFLYGEEVAWCMEAVRQGSRLGFSRDAIVTHYQGTSTGCTEKISDRTRLSVYLAERNRILMTRDYFPEFLLPASAISIFRIFVRFGRHAAWRQLGYAASGWWAGLRNMRGPASASNP